MPYSLDTDFKPREKLEDFQFTEWNTREFQSILKFLVIPAVFLMFVLLGVIPRFGLYIFSAIFGVMLLQRTSKDPEYLMAVAIFYIPLSNIMPVALLPGLNATNIFLLMLMAVAVLDKKSVQRADDFNNPFASDSFGEMPIVLKGTKALLLKSYIILTAMSAFTAMVTEGANHILSDHLLTYKGWVDQVLLIFVFAALIKDSGRALRVVIYMMISSVILTLLGLQEHIDRWGAASIEQSRVVGNSGNPNDFGGLLVYTFAPFVGIAITLLPSFRVAPYVIYGAIWLQVLLSTFSRGAYLALAVGLAAAGYIRGIKFSMISGIFVLVMIVLVPSVVPDALIDRMGIRDEGHTSMQSEDGADQPAEDNGVKDKSSMDRIVMWNAAIKMTMESPILGKGFKMFEHLVKGYAEKEVVIVDPHNMYLYISSQMGIPAALLFVFIWVVLFFRSDYLHRRHPQKIVRGVAIGGGMVAASIMVACMFGSRMVSIETCGLAWLYVIVINRLHQDFKAHELRTITPPEHFL